MNLTDGKRLQILSFVYKTLIVTLISVGLIFICGTIFSVFLSNAGPENMTSSNNGEDDGGQIFTGIGRIRVSTSDPQPGMVVIFVSFMYNPMDKPFSEELALRIEDFRNIIREYIASFHIADLQQVNEESMKAELLRRFNAILRLGQLDHLYFSDFMVVG